jgi:hypothetical protein
MSSTVTRIGWKKMLVKFWCGIAQERKHFGDLGVDGSLSLKWILKGIIIIIIIIITAVELSVGGSTDKTNNNKYT